MRRCAGVLTYVRPLNDFSQTVHFTCLPDFVCFFNSKIIQNMQYYYAWNANENLAAKPESPEFGLQNSRRAMRATRNVLCCKREPLVSKVI